MVLSGNVILQILEIGSLARTSDLVFSVFCCLNIFHSVDLISVNFIVGSHQHSLRDALLSLDVLYPHYLPPRPNEIIQGRVGYKLLGFLFVCLVF